MFTEFSDAVHKQFAHMTQYPLYQVNIEKDLIWDTYLQAFPKGTNPMFRKRTEHDCTCCKQFIRTMGNVVAVKGGQIISIWDVEGVGTTYQPVADRLAILIKSGNINTVFLTEMPKVGTPENYSQEPDGSITTFNHFSVDIPAAYVKPITSIGTLQNEARVSKEMFVKACNTFTQEALHTVMDLINAKAIYRGEEMLSRVDRFQDVKRAYDVTPYLEEKDIFAWAITGVTDLAVTRIGNSAIGSLIEDISTGKEIEHAVKSYEAKVAPENYKRSSAAVTPRMIRMAQETVESLGLLSALDRRYATIQDITVNNVLFADRQAKINMEGNPFEALVKQTEDKLINLAGIKEEGINDFLEHTLPQLESMDLLLEERLSGNLMSLIAPVYSDCRNIFQWDNNFSWCYNGEVADSIKARVKRAGGNVSGVLRCSLSWFNTDDLDLQMEEPTGRKITYGTAGRTQESSGILDVDMNAGGNLVENPVENISYSDRNRMPQGKYTLIVHNFQKRKTTDVGFEVEVEFNGQTHYFCYDKPVKDNEKIAVAEIFMNNSQLSIRPILSSVAAAKEVWGISTKKFHRVSTMLLSPNYWDGQQGGNKHYMFTLESCKNPGDARGFFNEFLNQRLHPHRKVLEMLSSQMKAPHAQEQLSGLGFSSTVRNSVVCRIKRATDPTTKLVKINF